jgi:hypothetical protein
MQILLLLLLALAIQIDAGVHVRRNKAKNPSTKRQSIRRLTQALIEPLKRRQRPARKLPDDLGDKETDNATETPSKAQNGVKHQWQRTKASVEQPSRSSRLTSFFQELHVNPMISGDVDRHLETAKQAFLQAKGKNSYEGLFLDVPKLYFDSPIMIAMFRQISSDERKLAAAMLLYAAAYSMDAGGDGDYTLVIKGTQDFLKSNLTKDEITVYGLDQLLKSSALDIYLDRIANAKSGFISDYMKKEEMTFDSLLETFSVKHDAINKLSPNLYRENAIKAINYRQPVSFYENYFSELPRSVPLQLLLSGLNDLTVEERKIAIAIAILSYLYRADVIDKVQPINQLRRLLNSLDQTDRKEYPSESYIRGRLPIRAKLTALQERKGLFNNSPKDFNGFLDRLGVIAEARNFDRLSEYTAAAHKAVRDPGSAKVYSNLFEHPSEFDNRRDLLEHVTNLDGQEKRMAIALTILAYADDPNCKELFEDLSRVVRQAK